MQHKRPLTPNPKLRKRLRVIGFISLFIGIPLLIIAMVDFFMSFGTMSAPSLFFLAFIGMPFIGVGAICLQQGYLGSYSRYVASEVSPVVVDTANYLYEGTKGNMQDFAQTFGQAMQGKVTEVSCSRCGHRVKATDQFCDDCGAQMKRVCPSCQTSNDGDARYCRQCGKELS